jgi:type IV secretory pathway protease TraF
MSCCRFAHEIFGVAFRGYLQSYVYVEWCVGVDGTEVGQLEENVFIKGRAVNSNKEYVV